MMKATHSDSFAAGTEVKQAFKPTTAASSYPIPALGQNSAAAEEEVSLVLCHMTGAHHDARTIPLTSLACA